MTSDHSLGIRSSRRAVEAIALCGLLWFTSLPLSWAKTRALVMGVGATSKKAADPNNPDNIAAYLQNFDVVIPLSYSEKSGEPTALDSAVQTVGDLAEAGAGIIGRVLTDNEKGQLLAIKNRPPLDELYVHSWGAPAVMEAIRQGYLPAPNRLIVIDPPNLTPKDAQKWGNLAASFPEMKLDIFVNKDELFEQIREVYATKASSSIGADHDFYLFGDVLANFTGRTITVHTFTATLSGTIHSYEIHSLKYFFEYAVPRGLFGLTKVNTPAVPAPEYLAGYTPDSESAYLIKVSPETAKMSSLEQSFWARQNEIRNPDKTADLLNIQQSREAGWSYFKAVVRYACADPEGLDSEASVHRAFGVVFAFEVISTFYGQEKSSLSECDRQLIEPILAAETPVSYGWLEKQARTYRRKMEAQPRKKRGKRSASGNAKGGRRERRQDANTKMQLRR